MKTLFLVLLCACATYAASSSFFSTPGASFSSRRDKDKGSSLRSSKKTHRKKDDVCSGSVVDASHGGSDYHFSWCNPEFKTRKFTGGGAEDYCSRRAPQGPWRAVTISDKAENDFIKNIIKKGEGDPLTERKRQLASRSEVVTFRKGSSQRSQIRGPVCAPRIVGWSGENV